MCYPINLNVLSNRNNPPKFIHIYHLTEKVKKARHTSKVRIMEPAVKDIKEIKNITIMEKCF